MKKAIIITECRRFRFNFGETLQAVALNKVISDMGLQCITASYERQYRDFRHWFVYNIKRYASRGIKFEIFRRKYIKTDVWRSSTKEDFEKLIKSSDVLICGSDCIWYEKDYNDIFFLYFPNANIPKISYAPSLRDNVILSKKYISDVSNWIQGINYLSTREKEGSKIIEKIAGREVETVLDPTLLIDKDAWTSMSSKRKISEPYVLFYLLGKTKRTRFIMNQIRNYYKDRKIIWIRMENNDGYVYGESLENVGPADFLSLVRYADAVVTDSFHGTAFSIIFNRQFYSLKRIVNRNDIYNHDCRITNILNILGLINYYDRYEVIDFEKAQVDYKKVNAMLKEERKKSLKFLKDAFVKEGVLE